MLEILFLIWFGKKTYSTAKSKGRSGGWAALTVLAWVGGEIVGAGIGAAAGAGAGVYVLALILAALSAGGTYAILSSLPNLEGVPSAPSTPYTDLPQGPAILPNRDRPSISELRQLGDIEGLVRVLQDKSESYLIRTAAVRALRALHDPRATETLQVTLREDADAGVREEAAAALKELGAPQGADGRAGTTA